MLKSGGRRDPRPAFGERAQVLVLWVAMFTVILGMGAFAIDQGLWLGKRRVSQKDADAAARAGALRYLADPSDLAGAAAQAQKWAIANLAVTSNPNTSFTASTSCTGRYINGGTPVPNVPSIQVKIDRPVPALFSRAFGVASIDAQAIAVACVGQPSSYQGSDPFYTAPGSQSDPCFQASGQPAIGVTCVFKTASQPQQTGSRGNLSLADGSSGCTKKNKNTLEEQIATGSQSFCSIGDTVNIAQGNNTAQNTKGLNCRFAGGCTFNSETTPGEGFCDASFRDPNGSIPPFTTPRSPQGIDDFTEAFSVVGGGRPAQNWATTGPNGDAQTLIPNTCGNGKISPRIFHIIIGTPCPCKQTVTIAGFATFYVFGCVKLDKDGNPTGPLDYQCASSSNSGIQGMFLKAVFQDGGGVPQPPQKGSSLSIFLVR